MTDPQQDPMAAIEESLAQIDQILERLAERRTARDPQAEQRPELRLIRGGLDVDGDRD